MGSPIAIRADIPAEELRDGVSAWRAKDLCRLVAARFGVAYSENGMLRLLHEFDLSWQKARPIHPEADPKSQERFKENP
jgi:transposase